MRIATHHSKNAPPEHAWLAAFYEPVGKAGKEERLPMVFFGRSEEDAIAEAETWMLDEQAKEAVRKAVNAERVARARARRPAEPGGST